MLFPQIGVNFLLVALQLLQITLVLLLLLKVIHILLSLLESILQYFDIGTGDCSEVYVVAFQCEFRIMVGVQLETQLRMQLSAFLFVLSLFPFAFSDRPVVSKFSFLCCRRYRRNRESINLANFIKSLFFPDRLYFSKK